MSQDILVALDPFARDPVSLKRAMATTKNLADTLGASIEPLAVVSPDQLQWSQRLAGSWSAQFEAAARASLKSACKTTGLDTEKVEVLAQPTRPFKPAVVALTDEAEKRKSIAIAIFTHHHKNPGLRFFGTFATSLLAHSHRPLLFINAKSKEATSFKTIFFATDFSAESEKAFSSILEIAKLMCAKVVLYHALVPLSADVFASAGIMAGFANYAAYVEDEEEACEKDAKKWLEKAKAAGVDVKFQMEHADFRTGRVILKAAQKAKADLIAVCSKSSGASAFILGSVTRDLLETSKLPLLVFPAKGEVFDATSARATHDRQGERAKSAPSPAR